MFEYHLAVGNILKRLEKKRLFTLRRRGRFGCGMANSVRPVLLLLYTGSSLFAQVFALIDLKKSGHPTERCVYASVLPWS